MKFNLINVVGAVALTSVVLSGCSSTDKKQNGFVDETAGIESLDNGLKTQTLGDNALGSSALGGGASSQYGINQGNPDGIALGEQRAKVISHILKMQGVPGSKVEIVSYGEEKPVASGSGHNESPWQLNRRAELALIRSSK